MALTKDSKKYWRPIPQVIEYLANVVIPPRAYVLEIGPGQAPFVRANKYVDFVDIPSLTNLTKCDVAHEPLPFADKEFDFVYSRHMLEDMYNPFWLCKEMSRVAKAGYIEMPSPLAEIARGVDGGGPPFRGYHHHRYIGWVDPLGLKMIAKYPFIEYLRFNEMMIEKLLEVERYWNTYFLWKDEVAVDHRQSPLHFSIPADYSSILAAAVDQSKRSTDTFFEQMGKQNGS